MVNILSDEAIVLRKSLSGDYDVSLTVYMKKYGKENIYIKNGQKLKSPFIYATEPFTWFKAVFIRRKEKFFIREIEKSVSLGIQIASDIPRFTTAYSITDLFNRYVIFPDEKIFVLLKKSLYYLTRTSSLDVFTANFIAKLVLLSGIFPELDRCVRCGSPVNRKNFKIISMQEGGVVCSRCSRQKPYYGYGVVSDLKKLRVVSFRDLDRIKLSSPSSTESFLRDYLERSF
ncbi:DNA repair protein RecO [Persephonella sp.]